MTARIVLVVLSAILGFSEVVFAQLSLNPLEDNNAYYRYGKSKKKPAPAVGRKAFGEKSMRQQAHQASSKKKSQQSGQLRGSARGAIKTFPEVDWAQPPVACVEEIVPAKPRGPCLDLTRVENPQKDWPSNISGNERESWTRQRRALQYCRFAEIQRREALQPGSMSPAAVQIAWMQMKALQKRDEKIKAVYEASRKHKIPAQILAGALFQESLFSELGIAQDGSNYSCGVGQVNISEWCRWAETLTAEQKAALGWPSKGVSCSLLPADLLRPFHKIAQARLRGLPEYKMDKVHFAGIKFEQVVQGFPKGTAAEQKLRFEAAAAFINSCQVPAYGISAKANELAHIYRIFIPRGMKEREVYETGERFRRKCQERGFDQQYPLHTGWLLAVGSYNAGPRAVDKMAFYNGWTREDMKHSETFEDFTPRELVHSLYWSGAYNEDGDEIVSELLNGNSNRWGWFKSCVLQRHISRVVSHTVLGGVSAPIDSLEGKFKCAKSKKDPHTGRVIESNVPPHRKLSDGQKRPSDYRYDWF